MSTIHPQDFMNNMFAPQSPGPVTQSDLFQKQALQQQADGLNRALMFATEAKEMAKALQERVAHLEEENQIIAEALRRLTNTEKGDFRDLIEDIYKEKHPPQSNAIDAQAILAVVQQMMQENNHALRIQMEDLLMAQAIRTNHAAPADTGGDVIPPQPEPQPAQLDQAAEQEKDDEPTPIPESLAAIAPPAVSSFEPVGGDTPRRRVTKSAAPTE